MEGLLSRLWRACMVRLSTWAQGYSAFTLSLTGILGLAAFLYLYRSLRGPAKRDEQTADPSQPSTSASAAAGPSKPSQPSSQPPAPAAVATAAQSAAARLGGAAVVTISVPGVILEESTPAQLEDSAAVRPEAAAVLRELLATAGRGGPAVYLMSHVEGDIGEAVVRGALEHAGLVGAAPGQLLPHRLLFCSTLEGKNSIVRQIEPDLHFDSHPITVRDLQRFTKRLVFVEGAAAGEGPAGLGGSNVLRVPSFAGFFGR